MKRMIIGCLAFVAINAHAVNMEICTNIGKLAEYAQTMHQLGKGRYDMMSGIKADSAKLMVDMRLAIADDAITQPIVWLSRDKQKVSVEFGERWFNKCLTGEIKGFDFQ